MKNKGVFLDRDGVLTDLVLNPKTHEYEAAQKAENLKLLPDVLSPLHDLLNLDFFLFIVSNQPDYAKGKTTFESLLDVHKKFIETLNNDFIHITECYYCYHHPDGIVKELSIVCECRKPGSFFLKKAQSDYNIDLQASWMIGDRDTDVICGRSAGTRTILINEPRSAKYRGTASHDYYAGNLKEAVSIIISEDKKNVKGD